MIVIAPTLSLTEPFQFTLDHPVIGYDNAVTVINIAASSQLAANPAVNMANPATHLKWKATAAAAQTVTVNQLPEQFFDYVGIARHNLGTAQCPVTVLGADTVDGFGAPIFDEALVPEQLLPNDAPALFRFTRAGLIAIRLAIGAGSAAPEIAVLYVGELLTLQRKLYVGHTPITMGREVQVTNGRSESGQYLGRVITGETRASAIQLLNLTPDWFRQYMDPFIVASAEQPFFFAWRPQSYPQEVGFAWVNSNPRPVNQLPNGMMAVDLSISGIS